MEDLKMAVTSMARGLAAQAWCDERTSHIEMDPVLAEVFAEKIDRYVDALIWCSGSNDFSLEGQARVGWEKLCKPLIDEWTALNTTPE